jgi:uncharacterized membrane protein YpjA
MDSLVSVWGLTNDMLGYLTSMSGWIERHLTTPLKSLKVRKMSLSGKGYGDNLIC